MPSLRIHLVLMLVSALGLGASACQDAAGRSGAAKSGGGKVKAPYDVRPLLTLLRAPERRSLAKELGLASLAELPYYELDLAVDPVGAQLAGRCRIFYRNNTGKPIRSLPLLLHPNAPAELGASKATAALLRIASAKALRGPKIRLRRKRPTLVELHFVRPLAVGAWTELDIAYSGRLRRLAADSNDVFGQALSSMGMSGAGAGTSDYGLVGVGDGIATLASAYPMVAPHRRGHFDTDRPNAFGDLAYNGLANYKVRTALPKGWSLVSNLVELPNKRPLKGGSIATTSVGAATRDLVISVARDFVRVSKQLGDVRVTAVHRARDAKAGKRLLRAAYGSLALFQRRFGRYPYRELDVTEATLVGGAGGVEFPGMVLIAGMFYRKPSRSQSPLAMLSRLMGGLGGLLGGLSGGAPQGGKTKSPLASMDRMIAQMGEFVVAHEVAHQYFAGVVGADCRSHPAVDEPLAQFAAGEYMQHVYGKVAGRRVLDLNARANYGIYRMLGGKDLPAAWPVKRYPSALAYAAIVYGKAPYLYVALREKLGARFDRALAAAVRAKRFRLVTLDSWIAALAKAAGSDGGVVRRLAKRYLKQRRGDRDLKVDDSGDAVLELMMGKATLKQIKQGMGMLGMTPKTLFRMLLGKMAAGKGSGGRSVDPKRALDQLRKLR